MTPNIYHSLLTHLPRHDRSSKENFLTEAFAHSLRTNPEVCRAWLSFVTGEPLDALRGPPDVETQGSFFAPDGKSWSIVDMVIRCGLANGGEMTVLSEHKWDSPADCGQLDRYLAIARTKPKGSVIFIAPTVTQIADVQHHTDAVKAIRWHDAYNFLNLHKTEADGIREFVEFLALQGFGPQEPLSWPKLAAYMASRSVEKDCLRLVAQLPGRDWSFLPKRFHGPSAYEKMKWGRIGIELNEHWNPCLFLGFLLDGHDHRLELVSPTSIDLMLSLDMSDTSKVIEPTVLTPLAESLRAPGVSVLHGSQLKKGPWRKLVVREALADTIRGKPTEAEQVDAIYARLEHWSSTLFAGGQLAKVLGVE